MAPESGARESSKRMARSREPETGAPLDASIPSVSQPEIGDQLKVMFGEMSAGPMPSRLLELADRLEEAFQRGDLFDCDRLRSRAS